MADGEETGMDGRCWPSVDGGWTELDGRHWPSVDGGVTEPLQWVDGIRRGSVMTWQGRWLTWSCHVGGRG